LSKSRSGSPRRVAAGLLAASLAVFGIALAPQAGATTGATGDRIAGTNRYGTAKAIAAQPDFVGAKVAILATGQNFPDALAASGVAGAKTPAPIVLTESNNYTQEAKDALNALSQVTDVIIVGGTAAVSDAVKDAVTADGFNVTRLAGTNRYGTAAAIANAIGVANVGKVGGKATAFVANGQNFPDALAGGPAAYAGKMPILLVTPSSVPAETSQALKDLAIKHVIVLGGTAAVSDATKTAIDGITGGDSERLAGVNRYSTAVAVANFELGTLASLGFDGKAFLLANGQNFPDALAGGPLGGDPEPILLGTPTALPTETAAACDDNSDTGTKVTALGGTAAIGDAVLQACVTGLKNTANDQNVSGTATSRPELVTSTISTIAAVNATATHPAGTYITYCFDEPVTGALPAPALFKVWHADGTFHTGEAGGATVTAGDNKCVEVRFGSTAGDSTLDTASEAASLTVATVAQNAVTGQGGAASDGGIEGDSPLTPAGSTTTAATAGSTSQADLVSVGNFRAGFSDDLTAADFTFDLAAFNQNPTGYHLVLTDNTDVTCTGPASGSGATPSGGVNPGGEGTVTHTVSCPEPVNGAHYSTASVVRGYVDSGTVDTTDAATGADTPLEAADVSASGNSDGPSLTTIVFAPDATASFDVAAFIFSENVQETESTFHSIADCTKFAIYDNAGNELAPAACSRSTENNSAVSALYPDNTFTAATYVGGNVATGGVVDLQAKPNRGDEVGAGPTAGPTTTSGRTAGPDLLSVDVKSGTSPFGNPTASGIFVFDEDTADASDPIAGPPGAFAAATEEVVLIGLHLWTPDGIRLDCSALSPTNNSQVLADRTEDNDAIVTCTSFVVGGTSTAATVDQVKSASAGTVQADAVSDEAVGGNNNPEGHAVATHS
jgi:putative cell wall-binding protein